MDIDDVSDPSESSNLKVGIRVRPMSTKEIEDGTFECVRVVAGKTITVVDPGREDRLFSFDHAFCSDTAQQSVYLTMASPLVGDVCLGKNATVFAYGATGSGKTHTMLGTQTDPGVMVRTLQGLFDMTSSADYSESFDFVITVAFMEIYNETVRDLLLGNKRDSGKGLEIREDKKLGVYVEGVTETQTRTAEEVIFLLQQGNKMRTTESTNANMTSSRSHAVLQITVTRSIRGTSTVDRKAKLSLIDLAGSEKSSATEGAAKTRQVEGANINKSLLALANCINKLGQPRQGGASDDKQFVNYRDSKLTRLLKESLGGNCKTVMIAAISPSSMWTEETISTLKYANRAKNIKTHVVENRLGEAQVSELETVVANLRSEVMSLRQRIAACEQNLEPAMSLEDIMVELKLNSKAIKEADPIKIFCAEITGNFQERIQLRRIQDEIVLQNKQNVIELRSRLQQLDKVQSDPTPLRQLTNTHISELVDVNMDVDDLREGIRQNMQISRMLGHDIRHKSVDAAESMTSFVTSSSHLGTPSGQKAVAAFVDIAMFSQDLDREVLVLREQLDLKDAVISDFVALMQEENFANIVDPNTTQFIQARIANKVRSMVGTEDEADWNYNQAANACVHTSKLQKRVVKGHKSAVTCCCFSKCGRYIASCSDDLTLRLWTSSGKLLFSFEGHVACVNHCVFSPDSSLILTASDDETLRLWDTKHGVEVAQLRGHFGPVLSCCFGPDGTQILSASFDERLMLWEAGKPDPVMVLEGHEGYVYSCDFSPTHFTCVSASEDKTIRVWDLMTGAQLLRLEGHEDVVYRCVFSSDGSMLCSASQDKTLKLWDLRDGNEVGAFVGHGDAVRACALSRDGRYVVSCSADNTVRVWDCTSGVAVRRFEGHSASVNFVDFHPSGNQVITCSDDGSVRVWQIELDTPSTTSTAAIATKASKTTTRASESSKHAPSSRHHAAATDHKRPTATTATTATRTSKR